MGKAGNQGRDDLGRWPVGVSGNPHGGRKGEIHVLTQALVRDILMSAKALGGQAFLESLGRKRPAIWASLARQLLPRETVISTVGRTWDDLLAELAGRAPAQAGTSDTSAESDRTVESDHGVDPGAGPPVPACADTADRQPRQTGAQHDGDVPRRP